MSEINIDSVDLNLIRLFVAVYEEKSATRAGLRLDQTQSAVSFSLTKLRHLYNDPLFVRTGRGLSPTLFADNFYPAYHVKYSCILIPQHGIGFGSYTDECGMAHLHRYRR